MQAFNAALKSGDMNLQALGIESDRGAAGMAGFHCVAAVHCTYKLSWLGFVYLALLSVALSVFRFYAMVFLSLVSSLMYDLAKPSVDELAALTHGIVPTCRCRGLPEGSADRRRQEDIRRDPG